MNFVKPTKIKVIGMLVIWFADIVNTWITAGVIQLVSPGFFPKAIDDVRVFREGLFEGMGLGSAALLSSVGFVTNITLIYLAVCVIVYYAKR